MGATKPVTAGANRPVSNKNASNRYRDSYLVYDVSSGLGLQDLGKRMFDRDLFSSSSVQSKLFGWIAKRLSMMAYLARKDLAAPSFSCVTGGTCSSHRWCFC